MTLDFDAIKQEFAESFARGATMRDVLETLGLRLAEGFPEEIRGTFLSAYMEEVERQLAKMAGNSLH